MSKRTYLNPYVLFSSTSADHSTHLFRTQYRVSIAAINLANEVFGFNGWSSQIISLNTDFVSIVLKTTYGAWGIWLRHVLTRHTSCSLIHSCSLHDPVFVGFDVLSTRTF